MVNKFVAKRWRAVIMAGGHATRFHPVSAGVNKHLLPVFDKPMIYFPLTTLMMGGLRDILILSTPEATPQFKKLMGDGSQWGISLTYRVQPKPSGIADVFRVCREDLEGRNTALILGDNIFYGHRLPEAVQAGARITKSGGAMVYAYEVGDPRAFGVIELDERGKAITLEEKPRKPKSNLAVPGMYFFDEQALEAVTTVKPSRRGELEITDLNQWYLERDQLHVERLGRGIAWLDGGTPEGLLEASNYIHAIEARQGLRAASPEEIALRRGYIDTVSYEAQVKTLPKCEYRSYLEDVAARL